MRANGADAWSLKIMGDKVENETLFLLLINRLATVSTGWKMSSSAIPDVPEPKIRAVPESFPLDGGGDMMVVEVQV